MVTETATFERNMAKSFCCSHGIFSDVSIQMYSETVLWKPFFIFCVYMPPDMTCSVLIANKLKLKCCGKKLHITQCEHLQIAIVLLYPFIFPKIAMTCISSLRHGCSFSSDKQRVARCRTARWFPIVMLLHILPPPLLLPIKLCRTGTRARSKAMMGWKKGGRRGS